MTDVNTPADGDQKFFVGDYVLCNNTHDDIYLGNIQGNPFKDVDGEWRYQLNAPRVDQNGFRLFHAFNVPEKFLIRIFPLAAILAMIEINKRLVQGNYTPALLLEIVGKGLNPNATPTK